MDVLAAGPVTEALYWVRTPMPWQGDAPGHGFTSGEPWLPFGPDHASLAVDRQCADRQSQLSFTREVLALRRRTPALRWGRLEVCEAGAQLLVFERSYAGRTVRCTFNLSDVEAPLRRHNGALIETGRVLADALGPYAALIEEIH